MLMSSLGGVLSGLGGFSMMTVFTIYFAYGFLTGVGAINPMPWWSLFGSASLGGVQTYDPILLSDG